MEEPTFKLIDYQGGYSSLKPNYGETFVGYRTDVNTLGVSTDPRSANIIQEVSTKLAPGQKHIELSMISTDLLDSVPKQYWKEAKRVADLAGAEVTIHGPMVDPAGFTDKGGFSEKNMLVAENQMMRAMESAHELNPDGGAPVTFHASGILPSPDIIKTKDGKEITEQLLVIDQESGQIHAVKRDTKHYPGERDAIGVDQKREKYFFGKSKDLSKGGLITAEESIDVTNNTQWLDSLTKLVAAKERVDRVLDQSYPITQEIYEKWELEGRNGPYMNSLSSAQQEWFARSENARAELRDIKLHLSSLFSRAYEYGNEIYRPALMKISENFDEALHKKDPLDPSKIISTIDPKEQSLAIQKLMGQLRELPAPRVNTDLSDFALKKASQTFGNVAFKSYEKYGDKSPIVSVENAPANMFALARGEDLKNVVEGSREKFVERMVDERGISKEKAKRIAEQMIGVTWDVGHINQLRKTGFTKKDIIKESEKIAPYLKHVHLSDNFGTENTELPMGMGNVPLKEIMEKLGEKGEKARKIVETGAWWNLHGGKISPMAATFEALGSPIYSVDSAPYWNQSIGYHQNYFGGYGQMLPQINYETFGAGFSNLPIELGGQRQGAQGSRMGGTPME